MKQRIEILLLLLAVLLAGCSRDGDAGDGEYEYQVYYLNSAVTRLAPQVYRTDTTDTDSLIDELMEHFLNVPADVDSQAALPERVSYQGYRKEEQVLYLYFDNNYVGMRGDREILCRAALTKTLTQIPEIEYINIYSGDQPLMDSQGIPVGMLAASDFVDSISDVNAYERAELTLYFTDRTGEFLWPEQRTVMHNVNTSMERLIVDELIKGPQEPGEYPTLPADVKLLNVSVNENVCYLNFDASFLNSPLEVREYIPIYSIVNSLSELATVNRVQISINGSQDVSFRDSISFNTPFERNLDYIGGQ